MLDLSAHRQDEEDDPVDHQDGPKDRDIENGEPRADEADGDGPGSGVPELELGEATDEGAELVVLLGGKAGGGVTVLKAFVLGEGGVEFGLKEEQEEVQEVDAEGVCDNVPSLSEDDSQEEDKQEDDGADPPVGCVGCQSIEGRLVLL